MQARFALPLVPFVALALVHCGSSSTTAAPESPPVVAEAGAADSGASVDASDAAHAPDAAATGPTLASMTTARALFAAVNGKDGRIRSVGGLTLKGLDDSAEAYDPATNKWTAAATPGAVRRYAHAATQDATGNIYVVGGTSDGASPIADFEMFSPSDGSWTTLADLPTARLGLAAATGKDGRIYAIGGRNASGAPTDTVEIYTPSTHAWTAGPSLATKRLSLVAVTGADGKIYAIGGRDANTTPLSVVEAFDIDAGTWTTVQPMLSPRYWFGATLGADGRIYALGGIDTLGFTDAIEAFTPASGWKQLPVMPEPRAWMSAAATADGRVFAIGGAANADETMPGSQPPPIRTMIAFDTKTGTWKK